MGNNKTVSNSGLRYAHSVSRAFVPERGVCPINGSLFAVPHSLPALYGEREHKQINDLVGQLVGNPAGYCLPLKSEVNLHTGNGCRKAQLLDRVLASGILFFLEGNNELEHLLLV